MNIGLYKIYLTTNFSRSTVPELHRGLQEVKWNDDSVTNELLILTLQKFEDDQGWYLENDDEHDETDEILLLASQKFEESIQVMDSFYSVKI